MRFRLSYLVPVSGVVAAFALLATAWLLAPAAAAEKKVAVPTAELPRAIKRALQKAFPKGEILKIEKEIEGEDVGQIDVDIRADGKQYEVEISPEGKIKETKEVKTLTRP